MTSPRITGSRTCETVSARRLRQLYLGSERGEIDIGCFPLDPIVKKIARFRNAAFKSFFAFAPDERIWIFARRHFGYAHDQIVLEQGIERTFGGFVTGCVGVKAKHNFIDEALQDPRLIFRKGRALRRDHIRDPRLEQADQIELAFTDDLRSSLRSGLAWICADQKARCPFGKAASPASSHISPRPLRLSEGDR